MAVDIQGGGLSMLWMGRQRPPTATGNIDGRYTPVVAPPNDNSAANERGVGQVIHRRFPFTGLGLDLASEQAQSASITGRDSATKRAGGQLWSAGDVSMEILPNDIPHWLRIIQNVNPVKANAKERALTGGNTVALAALPAEDILIPSTASIGAAAGSVVTFVGSRRIGLPDNEIRPLTEIVTVPTGETTAETKNYFTDFDSITGANGTQVTLDTSTYKTTLTGFGSQLSDALTIMMRKGLMPVTVYDALVNVFGLSISDTITATASMLGGPIFNRKIINKTGEIPTLESDNTDATIAGWLDDDDYPISQLDFMPSWGTLLEFGDTIVDVIGVDFGINLNLESKRSYRASRFRNKPQKSATPREITAAPRVYFENGDAATDVFNKWQDIYIDNATSDMTVSLYNWLDNGRQHKMVFTINGMQLIEVPTLTVEDSADIERDLSFLSTTAPGLTFELFADEYKE